MSYQLSSLESMPFVLTDPKTAESRKLTADS